MSNYQNLVDGGQQALIAPEEAIKSEQKAAYEDLAMTIFVRHPPQDPAGSDAWLGTSDPNAATCIITGRPISEADRSNVAKCSMCGHVALSEFWRSVRNCPLCHTVIPSSHVAPQREVKFAANYD